MNNEELTKIAWTRELTDERVRVAAAYWLDCSPHERTEADGIILARYARMAMEKLDQQAKEIETLKSKAFPIMASILHQDQVEKIARQEVIARLAVKALKEINAKFMDYIENNIECDSAATKMDEIAEKALEEIKRLGEGVNK